jgi:multiple sugar transport system substrate-binding protein
MAQTSNVHTGMLGRRSLLKLGGAAALAGVAGLSLPQSVLAQAAALRWSTVAFGPEALALWQQIADYSESQIPGLQIDVEGTPFNDYWTKLQTQLASGGGADLLQMQSLRFPGYASRNVFRPLNEFIEADPDFEIDDFYPAIRSAFEHEGQLQILPFDLGAPVTYINKDLFAARGVPLPDPEVPMTWEQLSEIAVALTDPDEGTYGMVLSPTLDNVIPWIWSNGGEVFSEDRTKALIGEGPAVEAVSFLTDLIHNKKAVLPITDLANANLAPEGFVSGKVGMYFDGPWRFVSIRQNAKFDWDIVPFPAGPAGSRTWVIGSGWGISTQSQRPDEAWAALKTLTGTQSLKILDDAGRVFPSRQSTYALRTPTDAPPANAAIVDKVLKGEIGTVRPLITPVAWNEIVTTAGQIMSPLFVEPLDVAGELAVLQSEIDPLLAE